MATKFTADQQRAIDTLDKSILVSAAAGSGKTAVLVERIISIILEGKANVDEMLVVTFTNAAAAEMRLRLASSIRKRMQEKPEEAARLRDQMARLYRAYISTIDSFVLRVIREFFYETDLEPEFSICDEIQSELLKREAAAELFEDAFENDEIIEGGSFRAFLRLYSDERSDERFISDLITSYDKLRTMPSYFEWAFEKAENLKVNKDTFEGSVIQDVMRQDAADAFERICEAAVNLKKVMEENGLEELFESKLKERCDALFEIYGLLKEGRMDEELMGMIASVPNPQLRPKNDHKEALAAIKDEVEAMRDVIKNELKNWQERYLVPDFEMRLSEMNDTYEYTVYYLRLMQEFEKRFSAKKREKRLLDFSDSIHTAVKILQNDEASEILRKRFKYVFVGEYQDTNNIQEHLISRVASPRNVFKVGDVKQSIYKFRQAEPAIFEELYKKYESDECEDGIVIDLGKNFRTNDATIRLINHVFEHVMDGYDERAKLYTGVDCPSEYDFKPEIHILLKEDLNEDEEGETEAEIEELSNSEAESVYIADLVDGIIGKEFYDTKKKVVRKAEARDIAILYRSVKYSGEEIVRALSRRKIEAHIEETDDFFDTIEINIALSLLSCIDNIKRDVPLIATLHSEMFGFDPKELADIRIAYKEQLEKTGEERKKTPYWQAFKWYAEEGPAAALKDKVCDSLSRIMEWRRLSRIMPLDDFIWKVLVDSGYYGLAGAMSGGGRRQANLRALADRAGRFSKDTVASLSSFITFVEVMKSKGISNGQTPMVGKDDNVVRISTMHKSKGLEFPFVIVGGLGRSFMFEHNEKKFSFNSKTGVGMPYIDPDRRYWRSSIMQMGMNARDNRDTYKEYLRLLYVDMTRARNKLYLVGACKDEDSLMKYGKANDYLKVLKDFIKSGYCEYHIRNLDRSDDEEKSYKKYSLDADKLKLSARAEEIYKEIDRRFSFEYPYKDMLSEKSKHSVSSIRKEELEEEAASSESEVVNLWDRSEKKKRASAADIGIAYHRIMEFIDFKKVLKTDGDIDKDYISERAEYLRSSNAIEEDVFASLDIDNICGFFRTDIGRRALKAAERGTLKKEKSFTLRTTRKDREILVQGVIDCCFEEERNAVLIVYKSSYIGRGADREKEIERIRQEYKKQIELYSEAVEKGTGLNVSESYLYLFAAGEAVRI